MEPIDKELHLISFKSFLLKEMPEEKKNLLKEFNNVVTVSPEELSDFLQKEKKTLSEQEIKDCSSLIRMLNKTEDKWNKMDWSRCKRFIGNITETIFKDPSNKKQLFIYGHKG